MKHYIRFTLIITVCLQPVLSVAMSDDQKRDLLIMASGVPLLAMSYLGCKYIDDNRVVHRVAASRRESVERSIDLKWQAKLDQLERTYGKNEAYLYFLRQRDSEKVKQGQASYNRTYTGMSGLVGGVIGLPMFVPLLAYKAYCQWYQ